MQLHGGGWIFFNLKSNMIYQRKYSICYSKKKQSCDKWPKMWKFDLGIFGNFHYWINGRALLWGIHHKTFEAHYVMSGQGKSSILQSFYNWSLFCSSKACCTPYLWAFETFTIFFMMWKIAILIFLCCFPTLKIFVIIFLVPGSFWLQEAAMTLLRNNFQFYRNYFL